MNSIELLNQKYESGYEQEVWNMLSANSFVWHSDYHAFLEIVMKRVQYNLEMIYEVLQTYNYTFFDFSKDNVNEQPFILEQTKVDRKITELEEQYSEYGFLPKIFSSIFRKIRVVNFIGYFDFDVSPHTLDALFIIPLNEYLVAKDYLISSEYNFESKKDKYSLMFSPCDLHKINVSGQGTWNLELIDSEQIDGKLSNFYKDITFLEYLREIFKWGGLMGLEEIVENNQIDIQIRKYLKKYLKTVRMNLKPI